MSASDLLNPVVVKEVRQGLRTRSFAIFFGLLLVVCVLVSLVASAQSYQGSSATGSGAFTAVLVALSFVEVFVIPYSAFRTMAREQEDETWVLLTLTGLGARRILAGKISSALLQGGLYASAAAPFLLFSYFLNGVDLPSVMLTMIFITALQIFVTSVAVSAATFAESRVSRALLHFVLLGLLFWAWTIAYSGALSLVAMRLTSSRQLWLGVTAAIFTLASTGGLVFEGAAARLSLAAESYARGPRRAFVVQIAGFTVLIALAAWVAKSAEPLGVGVVALSAYLGLVGMMVSADVDGLRPSHLTSHRRASLFAPGGLRGYLLVVLLLVGSTLALWLLSLGARVIGDDGRRSMVAAPLYALLYLSAAQLVGRWLAPSPGQVATSVRLWGVALVGVGIGLPPLIGLFWEDATAPALNLLNPLVGFLNIANQARAGALEALGLLGLATAISVVGAVVTLVRADRRSLA